MKDICFYCHNELQYEDNQEMVLCNHCRQWMKVIYFGKEQKKQEELRKNLDKYKDEMLEMQSEKTEALKEKEESERLLQETLTELDTIYALQDDVKAQGEVQTRLEALSERIYEVAKSDSVSLAQTAGFLRTMLDLQGTANNQLSEFKSIATKLINHSDSANEKLGALTELTHKLIASQEDNSLKATAMVEYVQKLGSDISQDSRLMQDIYSLFQQTSTDVLSVAAQIRGQTEELLLTRKKNEQQIKSINECLHELDEKVGVFHQELKQDKIDRLNRMNETALGLICDREFEEAEAKYEEIIENGADNLSELYFRKLLCKFGVEYVHSDYMDSYVPTMFNVDMVDETHPEDLHDVKQILRYADGPEKAYYEKKISEIARIADEYRHVKLESQYDVFISVKQQDDGYTTADSDQAARLYNILSTQYHLKVFNSKFTGIPGGKSYEPYILAALRSAKLMIVVAGKQEYVTAPWVANEWNRYLWLVNNDKRNGLHDRVLVYYLFGDLKPNMLPRKVQGLQAIEEGIGSGSKLRSVVESLFKKEQGVHPATNPPQIQTTTSLAENKLNRAFDELSVGDFKRAADLCEEALDFDPQNGRAYLYKLMAERQVNEETKLGECNTRLDESKYYRLILQYGDDVLKRRIEKYNEACIQACIRREEAEEQQRRKAEELQKIKEQFEIEKYNESVRIKKYHGNQATIEVPDYIDDKPVTILGDHAFSNCKNLTSIRLPKNLTSLGECTFAECKNLTNIELPESLELVRAGAFYKCENLYSIRLPKGLKAIGSAVFSGCRSLTKVELPEGLTSIENHTFYKCVKLESIRLPKGLTSLGENAFDGCRNLTNIELPNGLKSIGDYAFAYCDRLTGIRFPRTLSHLGRYAFVECKNLTNIELPEGLARINEGAFSHCKSLVNITLPEALKTIGSFAFSSCQSLTSISLPQSITSIGASAFTSCTSLKEINIPECVTSIGKEAFLNCDNLISIDLPKGITVIGDRAFLYCPLTIHASKGSYAYKRCKAMGDKVMDPNRKGFFW